MISRIKIDPKSVNQRKIGNKEVEIYVYEYLADNESCLYIVNMTPNVYSDEQTYNAKNLIYPFNHGKNTNTVRIASGKSVLIRMRKKNLKQKGDFTMDYKVLS